MKKPYRMHRRSSVIAAALMLLALALYLAASFSGTGDRDTPFFAIKVIGEGVATVALSVILFRGRKDIVSGVVFLVAMLVPVIYVAYELLVVIAYALGNTSPDLYTWLCVLSGVVLAAFRTLAAVECLSKGKVSAGGVRVLLWLLPVLCFCIELWAQLHLRRADGISAGDITSSLIFLIPQWLGPVLMGVSLCLPGGEY